MAGDQPPQGAVDDDRHRHGRGHAHVAQVFAMDGRNAAQMGIGQIQRFGLRSLGQDRHRHKGRVADHPDGIAQIQGTGLLGNVARREILAAKAFLFVQLGLGHDLARTVLAQLIDHHPVVSQLRLHQHRGLGDQPVGAIGAAQPFDHRARQADDRPQPVRGRLELDDGLAPEAVNGHVQHLFVQQDAKNQGRARVLARHRQGVEQPVRVIGSDHLGQGLAQGIGRQVQHHRRIGGTVNHPARGIVAGQKAAMGLDAAGNVDRLAVAIGQVDGLADQGCVKGGAFVHASAFTP